MLKAEYPQLVIGATNAANAGYHQETAGRLMELASYSHVTVIPEILPGNDYTELDNPDYSPANVC